jgi:SAM-dependent methyltransferase
MNQDRPTRRWTVHPRGTTRLPAEAIDVYERFLRERFPRATGDRLAAEVASLSEAFTAERGELPGSYLNQPPRRSAYLAYFHPQQVLRGLSVLEETRARAERRGLWPTGRPRVLDLGAGLGAMSQALLLAGTRPSELTLVDHQKSALADARDLTLAIAGADPPRIRTANERLGAWLDRARREGWRYDLALMGGVLNEIDAEWAPVVERVAAVLDPAAPGGGVVVIVEPAIPTVARKLMELREGVLAATTTIAPCTHGVGCPLLALRKDWCFTVRMAEMPPRVAALAQGLGHQTDQVRFALWAFAARADAAPPEEDTRRHARVVSDRMEGEHVLCIEGRRERMRHPGPALRGDLATG